MPNSETAGARPRKERKENAERRRRQLIEATLRSIGAKGLAKTTLATVAEEAGLSQGVAVFYFKTKDDLLAEALAYQYAQYDAVWSARLAAAGDDPADRLSALIAADFSPEASGPEALAIWFAFWGEAQFRPRYSEISREFDDRRGRVILDICAELMPEARLEDVRDAAISIESLTDGFWQRLYLDPDDASRAELQATSLRLLQALFPAHAARFAVVARRP